MVSKMVFLLYSLLLFGMEVDSETLTKVEITPRSCLDHLKKGHNSDGYYTIYDFQTNDLILVYCDMTSEAGSAWTLVMSYAFKNRNMNQMTRRTLGQDAPVNENSPNWNLYRMSPSQMAYLKSQSTHWRSTCSFPSYKVDYTDYVRAKFTDFDIMTLLGHGICKKVEYVNIRGHQCAQCTSKWWQVSNVFAPHIDSSFSGCQFVPTQGSTPSENNFGFYLDGYNRKFRCSSGPLSTTNWWFGGYL
ncbi:uncharacterized protein LOC114526401 [Dendronephthya gigantea]|uniref:uncharacterized protein LOC114526401 n=1 Tax=Dendronephthya gigantea TaxID=151771 RepID=UPI00106CCB32|nr:uncharacterized protein LOC114526401 [Dendronephthya gigantea]